jgi:hypothetical protein
MVKQKKYMKLTQMLQLILKENVTRRTKQIDGETWYHQTHIGAAEMIMRQGFKVFSGQGQARYTEGSYFLNHPEGRYGDVVLGAKITGKFVDYSDDDLLLQDWTDFKNTIPWDNYTELTQEIQKLFPDCVGIVFPEMLVVWFPDKAVKSVWKVKRKGD